MTTKRMNNLLPENYIDADVIDAINDELYVSSSGVSDWKRVSVYFPKDELCVQQKYVGTKEFAGEKHGWEAHQVGDIVDLSGEGWLVEFEIHQKEVSP